MERRTARVNTQTRRRVAQELGLVRGAIAMVASRRSPRVTVAGLQFGEELMPKARQLAEASGVSLKPLWRMDETGCDVTIELPE